MGLELELLFDQLPPLRTAAAAATTQTAGDDGAVDGGCATPTSAANVLLAPTVCPPAPRKMRPRAKRNKHKRCCCGRRRCSGPAVLQPAAQARWVIAVPHDLAAVFVARQPAASTGASRPCMPPAGKKIRLHVVG